MSILKLVRIGRSCKVRLYRLCTRLERVPQLEHEAAGEVARGVTVISSMIPFLAISRKGQQSLISGPLKSCSYAYSTDPKRARFSSRAWYSPREIACCLSRSLFTTKSETFVKELRMPRLSSLRLASLIGLLGSALVIIGFFLPSRFVTVAFPPNPTSYSADSFWSMLSNTITGGTIRNLSSEMAIGSFLLTILIPLLPSLAGFLGKGKRVILIFSLGFAILGFLEFLIFSALLLSFSTWGGRVTEIHTSGPGFWLMLSGFPLCIGSSIIAQHLLSKPRPTVIKSPDGLRELARLNEFRRPPRGFF